MTYTAELIKAQVETHRDELFASYALGRPPTWKCDQRTQDYICINNWMASELTRIGIDDLGRIMQQQSFNRQTRSQEDMFGIAAQLLNDALVDNIDRNRRPHRRWG